MKLLCLCLRIVTAFNLGFYCQTAYESLEKEGIDLSGIEELIGSGESLGVILEVEDHRKNEKTVISIE